MNNFSLFYEENMNLSVFFYYIVSHIQLLSCCNNPTLITQYTNLQPSNFTSAGRLISGLVTKVLACYT